MCHFLNNIGFLMMGKLASKKKRFVMQQLHHQADNIEPSVLRIF
jgi:hypothetical protein